MTIDTSASLSSADSDEALIAELTPEMLAKLKADSRKQAIREGALMSLLGVYLIPNAYKQFSPAESSPQPNQIADWIGLLVLLVMIGFVVHGGITMLRGFIGRPALLHAELLYRRQHDTWRWER
ncbi:hypothetical protein [Dongia sp.]|uniref:hypothetical protein n=1 Tax=Dongia sp. TaxID=1977262 RepID=UPI0037509A49